MSLESIRQKLVDALADVDAMMAPAPDPRVVPVPLGANLFDMIESNQPGMTYLLPEGYTYDATVPVQVRKPTRIEGPPYAGGVRSAVIRVPKVEVLAPGVMLNRLLVIGRNKDWPVVVAGPDMAVVDCRITSENGARRGIEVNAGGVQIVRSAIDNIWHREDAQAIAGWDGTTDLLVEDCTLEASGENVMFGGSDCPADRIPKDITIRRCVMSKPLSWRGRTDMTVKNIFELKNAVGVLVEDCALHNVWAHGQTGYAVLLTVRNQYGTAPWSTIQNVVFRRNHVRSMGSAIQILARDDRHESVRMRAVDIVDNTFDDITPGVYGGSGKQLSITNGPLDLTVTGNTFIGTGLNSFISFAGGVAVPVERFVFERNNVMEGAYGIHGDGAPVSVGKPTLDYYAPGYVWSGNVVTRTQTERWINYPAGTTMVIG